MRKTDREFDALKINIHLRIVQLDVEMEEQGHEDPEDKISKRKLIISAAQ